MHDLAAYSFVSLKALIGHQSCAIFNSNCGPVFLPYYIVKHLSLFTVPSFYSHVWSAYIHLAAKI